MFLIYYVYNIRKQLCFQQSVLESLQQQLFECHKRLEQQKMWFATSMGADILSPSPLEQPQGLRAVSHPSITTLSETKPSSPVTIPQGLMSNFLYVMNAVASTPPLPEQIIEQEMEKYHPPKFEKEEEDEEDTFDLTLSDELEQELKELQLLSPPEPEPTKDSLEGDLDERQ